MENTPKRKDEFSDFDHEQVLNNDSAKLFSKIMTYKALDIGKLKL